MPSLPRKTATDTQAHGPEDTEKQGARLAQARGAKGLDQKTMAEAIGMSPGNLSKIESGRVRMDKLFYLAVEHATGISRDFVQHGRGPMVVGLKGDQALPPRIIPCAAGQLPDGLPRTVSHLLVGTDMVLESMLVEGETYFQQVPVQAVGRAFRRSGVWYLEHGQDGEGQVPPDRILPGSELLPVVGYLTATSLPPGLV